MGGDLINNLPVRRKKKLPAWVKFLIGVAVAGVFLLVISSVGWKVVANLFYGKHATVDITSNGVVVKDTQSGQEMAIQATQQLPAGFPADIPVFSPSQVSGSMMMGPMTMVHFETASTLQEVAQFYQTKTVEAGWAVAFQASPNAQNFAALYRKETRQLTVNVSMDEPGKTSLALTYGLEQAATPPSAN